MDSRDRADLLRQVAWARQRLGVSDDTKVVTCYEAGRDGFWLHRFLEAQGFMSLVVDSSSIEVIARSDGRRRIASTWLRCSICWHAI